MHSGFFEISRRGATMMTVVHHRRVEDQITCSALFPSRGGTVGFWRRCVDYSYVWFQRIRFSLAVFLSSRFFLFRPCCNISRGSWLARLADQEVKQVERRLFLCPCWFTLDVYLTYYRGSWPWIMNRCAIIWFDFNNCLGHPLHQSQYLKPLVTFTKRMAVANASATEF
jgi:hypothetical protein